MFVNEAADGPPKRFGGNAAGLSAEARVREVRERVGGSNSVVESQPSKLLVAGSIPVSRSSLRSLRELRVARQPALRRRFAPHVLPRRFDERQRHADMSALHQRPADLSAEAPKARRPM